MMMLLLRKILMILILSLGFAKAVAQDATPQIPSNLDLISLENVDRLTELAHYGQGEFTGNPAWSPDGRYVTVPESTGVWIFSPDNIAHPIIFSEPEMVHGVAWSADGKTVAIAMDGATEIRSFPEFTLLKTFDGGTSAAYSPDDQFLVVTVPKPYENTGLDTMPVFEVIQAQSGDLVSTIPGDGYSFGDAFFTRDGKYLITLSFCYLPPYCEANSSFQIWDIHRLPPTSELEYPINDDVIVGISAAPLTGSKIAYIKESSDGLSGTEATVFDIASGQTVHLKAGGKPFQSLLWSAPYVLAFVGDSTEAGWMLYAFDPNSGAVDHSVQVSHVFQSYAVRLGNTSMLADSNGGSLRLFTLDSKGLSEESQYALETPNWTAIQADAPDLDVSPCIRLHLSGDETDCGQYNHEGSLFAGAKSIGGGQVYLWNTQTLSSELLVNRIVFDSAGAFTFSPDDKTLAFEVSDCLMNGRCTSSTVYLWSVDQHRLLGQFQTDIADLVQQLVFAPSEQNLLVAVTTNAVEFVDARTGSITGHLPSTGVPIWHVSFSSDGRSLYSLQTDGEVYVWGVKAGGG